MSSSGEFHPRVAINGNCFQRESLEHDLEFCERHGIAHLTVPVVKFEKERDRGIDAMQRSPVQTSTLILPSLFTLDDEGQWPTQTRRLIDAIDAAATVDAAAVYTTTGPAGRLDWEAATDALARALKAALEHASARGVRLLVESTNPMYAHLSFLFRLDDALDLTERTGLGLVVDLFPCYHERNLVETLSRAAGRIELLQVSDYVPGQLAPDNPGGLSIANRAVPGDGHAPLEAMARKILADGYAGLIDLELFGPRVDQEGPEAATLRGAGWISRLLNEAA